MAVTTCPLTLSHPQIHRFSIHMLLFQTYIQIHTAINTVKVFSMSASEMMPALLRLRRTFWICFLSPGINEWRRSNITISSGPSSDGQHVLDIDFSQMSASFWNLMLLNGKLIVPVPGNFHLIHLLDLSPVFYAGLLPPFKEIKNT